MPLGYLITGGLGNFGGGSSSVAKPTLVITDDGDGSGATATVSGSTAGTTNTVSAYSVDFETGALSLYSSGSSSGDGNVSLTLAPGFFIGYAVSVLGDGGNVSDPYAFRVTDTTDAVQKQALDSVVNTIKALALTGLSVSEIRARKTFYDRKEGVYPGITVSWTEEQEAKGVNARDDSGYPFLITMCVGNSQGRSERMGSIATWRQKIFRAFHEKKLSGITVSGVNSLRCLVQRKAVTVDQKYVENKDVSQLIVTCWFREPRI